MTLSFSTQINGKPNYFIEKIWESFPEKDIDMYDLCVMDYRIRFGGEWDGKYFIHHTPKLHTIRRDEHNRWRAGMDIHAVINNRTPNRFQFAPVIECKSIQTIRISYEDGKPNVYIDGFPFYFHTRRNTFGENKMNQLAANDGFDGMADFFAYFNTDFTGKLIHWTDLKY